MFGEIFESGSLTIIYALVLGISFFFALLSLIGVGVGDMFDFDVDSELDFISISPFAIASFGAIFGLVGLITLEWLEMSPIPSILVSSGVGVVFGLAAQAFFIYILAPSKSSHYSLETDAVGREAEVTITIPGSGLGQVAFTNQSGRVTLGARSTTGSPIRTGEVIQIERISGRVAFVTPIERE
jgi:hypothetical protein